MRGRVERLADSVGLILVPIARQDVDVLTVDGDLCGLVAKGVYGVQALRERRQVGDLGLCEPCREPLREIVVESVESLARTFERLVDERVISHGRGGNGLAQALSGTCDAAEHDGVNGAGCAGLQGVAAGRVKLAIGHGP